VKKSLPSERIERELAELLSAQRNEEISGGDLLSRLIKKSVEKLLQEAMEHEVSEYLGRGYFERGERERSGYRNGYEGKRLKTAEGLINLLVPQLRDTETPYHSRLLEELPKRSGELERLITESYVRGLSTRDIEDSFKDAEGEPLLSKSSVSKITDSINEDYEQFCQRDLSQFDLVYLFVDGVYESLRLESAIKEGLLCAWGITSNGCRVLLHLSLGNRESKESWSEFFRDMQRRGLRMPLLIIGDGSAGLIAAIESCFPMSKRQRCLFHKLSNIAAKLPISAIDEVMPEIRSCYYSADIKFARKQAELIIERFSKDYPSAIKCFQDDFEACIVHLEFPKGHHKFIRTTNLIERCFGEQKRRTKVIPRFLNEQSGIKLVFATLSRVSQKWYRIKMSEFDLALLKNMRHLYGNKIQQNDGFISMKVAA
jgi:transposase-like protein